MILHDLLAAGWFLLPAAIANLIPVIATWLAPAFDWPIDLGLHVRGRRLFGDHKTWRGFVAGIAAAGAVFYVQQALYTAVPVLRLYSAFDYDTVPWFWGPAMGAAALIGDLAKSAFKRQLDIPPGRAWIPFDQGDWLLATLALTAPVFSLPADFVIEVLLVGLALHFLFHFIGHRLGLNPTPI